MSEITTAARKIKRPSGVLQKGESPNRKWIDGYVYTAHGVVTVYQEEKYGSAFGFVLNGMLYDRQFDASFSERYLVTLAARFAKEIAEERKQR